LKSVRKTTEIPSHVASNHPRLVTGWWKVVIPAQTMKSFRHPRQLSLLADILSEFLEIQDCPSPTGSFLGRPDAILALNVSDSFEINLSVLRLVTC